MTAKSDMKKFVLKVNKFLNSVQSKAEMEIIGNNSIDIIRKRTQGGKGVAAPYGNRLKLRDVSPEYAERRKKIKRKSKLAATGTKCNLTLFGSMLRNLVVLAAGKGKVIIGHTGKKNQIKTAAHHETGRSFLFLAAVEMKKIIDLYDKRISRKSKKI